MEKELFFIKRSSTNKKVVEFFEENENGGQVLKNVFTSGEAAINSLKIINLVKNFSSRTSKG